MRTSGAVPWTPGGVAKRASGWALEINESGHASGAPAVSRIEFWSCARMSV
jgi:hypothetical protein